MDEDDREVNEKSLEHDKVDDMLDEPDSSEEKVFNGEINFDKEADITRKVLQNVISSTSKGADKLDNDNSGLSKEMKDDESLGISKKSPDAFISQKAIPGNSRESKETDKKPTESRDELQRTIFITNLPFDISNEEVKQRFSAFGEVESFVPVLHHVTKYECTFPFGHYHIFLFQNENLLDVILILHFAGDQGERDFSNLKQ